MQVDDYNHVPECQQKIHARLEDWARWVVDRPNAWPTSPMFRHYRSHAWQWSRLDVRQPVNTLGALETEKAVSALPPNHRDSIRWSYVRRNNPVRMARTLGVSKGELAQLVVDARTMLMNRLHP